MHKYFTEGNFAEYIPQTNNSAHNNLLLTRVIAPMEDKLAIELCMHGYHV